MDKIIDKADLDKCVKEKASSLLLSTRDAMQKSSPQITLYPSATFNGVRI